MESSSGHSIYAGSRERAAKNEATVSGHASYSNDLQFPSQLYAQFVRSPHASAHIRSIDLSAALSMHGVVLALDGAMAAQHLDPIPHYVDPANAGVSTL